MQYQLKLHGDHYSRLREHLFPGDSKEAVALILCGRHETDKRSILLGHDVLLIPHNECDRDGHFVKWKTTRALPFFEQVEKHNFAIVKIHSHPTGYPEFSDVDDESDSAFFPAAFNWSETDSVHASLVMLPDGQIFGRIFTAEMEISPIDRISIIGEQIQLWDTQEEVGHTEDDAFAQRTIQAFGDGTYNKLKKLRIGVVGCSGTGSPIVEQLSMRLGVGELVLVDPDKIELKNLNRIINSRKSDVGNQKVNVLKQAIKDTDLGTIVYVHSESLFDSMNVLSDLALCDGIFGCMDTVDGRNLLGRLTNFYLIPYFDLGVRLIAGDNGSVKTVVGSVHYLQPGKSTLLSRGMYTHQRLTAESLRRTSPERYKELLKQKYIEGVDVDRPAVISVNMIVASLGVTEFLNRIHPFKDEPGNQYARVMIDCCAGCIENTPEKDFDPDLDAHRWAGRGICKPFLRMPELI